MNKALSFKFGDVLLNKYAGEDNPIKKTIYINSFYRKGHVNSGKTAKCVDMRGELHEYNLDRFDGHYGRDWLIKIGNIFDNPSLLIEIKQEYETLINEWKKNVG